MVRKLPGCWCPDLKCEKMEYVVGSKSGKAVCRAKSGDGIYWVCLAFGKALESMVEEKKLEVKYGCYSEDWEEEKIPDTFAERWLSKHG